MAAAAKGKIYRVAGNAGRVIGPVLAILVLLGIVTFANLAAENDYSWPWSIGGTAIMLLFWWASDKGLGRRLVRLLSEQAVKSDLAWAVISRVLWAARRIRAAFAWLFATPPFQLLARLTVPLAVVLTATVTYRLAALPALLARDTGGSSADLALLVLDWLLLGLGYGAIGLAAPFVAALLLLRRRKSSLAAAMVLHMLGLLVGCLALLRVLLLVGFMGPLGITASLAEIGHPVFTLTTGSMAVIALLFADVLVNFLALVLLSRPRVMTDFDDQKPAVPPGQAAAGAS